MAQIPVIWLIATYSKPQIGERKKIKLVSHLKASNKNKMELSLSRRVECFFFLLLPRKSIAPLLEGDEEKGTGNDEKRKT